MAHIKPSPLGGVSQCMNGKFKRCFANLAAFLKSQCFSRYFLFLFACERYEFCFISLSATNCWLIVMKPYFMPFKMSPLDFV